MISKYQVTSPPSDQNQDSRTTILAARVHQYAGWEPEPRTGCELLLLSDLVTSAFCASVSSSKCCLRNEPPGCVMR